MAWDEAVRRGSDVRQQWAAAGTYDTYANFVAEIPMLDWSEGPFAGHGTVVGDLLGNIGIEDWLADRPISSALVVRAEDGGKGLPGGGWFDFCRRLGLMTDDHLPAFQN